MIELPPELGIEHLGHKINPIDIRYMVPPKADHQGKRPYKPWNANDYYEGALIHPVVEGPDPIRLDCAPDVFWAQNELRDRKRQERRSKIKQIGVAFAGGMVLGTVAFFASGCESVSDPECNPAPACQS